MSNNHLLVRSKRNATRGVIRGRRTGGTGRRRRCHLLGKVELNTPVVDMLTQVSVYCRRAGVRRTKSINQTLRWIPIRLNKRSINKWTKTTATDWDFKSQCWFRWWELRDKDAFLKNYTHKWESCHTTLSLVAIVAVLGGLESTVGMTSLDALRWESVAVPSLLIHIITIGVLAIREPKPLYPNDEERERVDLSRTLALPSIQPLRLRESKVCLN